MKNVCVLGRMARLSDIVPQEEYTRYIRLGAGRTIMVMPELQKSSEQLAGYLGGTFADVTTRQKGNTYYKDFTITEETKELYAKEYGYEETEFLAGEQR